ncbi:MAG: hypothetical protein V7752_22015 [Halopseudomonas sp.]
MNKEPLLDLLMKVSSFVDAHPQIAELDLTLLLAIAMATRLQMFE